MYAPLGASQARNRLNIEYREALKQQQQQQQQGDGDSKKSKKKGAGDSIILFPNSPKNLFEWTAYIKGPPDSPYEGGTFQLRLQVPPKYPLKPPKVHFKTKVCHPNVLFKTGEICLDILKDAWTPVWTLETTCRAIVNLLDNPEASSPLNCDAGNLIRGGDMKGFNSLAKMYTQEYAMENPSLKSLKSVVKK
mmetsp:Transcript_27510/g.38401  ORF Transcript_27510/g.38401 Transcript_27510/m.38401 type:complete len:192 (+) Transcript_27510:100-675(+)